MNDAERAIVLTKIDVQAKLLVRILQSLTNCPSSADERRMALAHYFNQNAESIGILLEQMEPEDLPDTITFPPIDSLLERER